jgi:hypothetical protein
VWKNLVAADQCPGHHLRFCVVPALSPVCVVRIYQNKQQPRAQIKTTGDNFFRHIPSQIQARPLWRGGSQPGLQLHQVHLKGHSLLRPLPATRGIPETACSSPPLSSTARWRLSAAACLQPSSTAEGVWRMRQELVHHHLLSLPRPGSFCWGSHSTAAQAGLVFSLPP